MEIKKRVVSTEKTLVIKSPNKYLGDVMSDLPDNVYLNKTSTGCGATHLCLTNSVDYVVVVPYVSLIRNKTQSLMKNLNINVLPVYGEMTLQDITSYVKDTEVGKRKIMVTYDSLYKVVDSLKQLGVLKKFKLCCDEAHSLISLSLIKGKCFKYLYSVYQDFKSFVFVTATPNDQDLLPDAIKDVEYVRVSWENCVRVLIKEQRVDKVSGCNNLVIEICKQHMLNEVDGNAYIFYNSVNEIISVIKKLKKMTGFNESNVNIFCASTDYNDDKVIKQLGKRFLGGSFDDCKKINFLTSCTFEGCDINDVVGKTYIIVSSKRNSTALTNHILVPQICGRLRNSVYKNEVKMLICGFTQDRYSKDWDSFVDVLKKQEADSKYEIERTLKAKEDGFDSIFQRDMLQYASNSFIVEDMNGNPVLNDEAFKFETQVYRAFNEYFVTIPNGTEIANTVREVENDMFKVSDVAKTLVNMKADYSRMMKQYIRALESGDTKTADEILNISEEHAEHIRVLGVDKIKALGCRKNTVTRAYNLECKFNDESFRIRENLKGLSIGGKYTTQQIKDALSNAYDKVGIHSIAKSGAIQKYFNVKVSWFYNSEGKRCKGLEIISDLYSDNSYVGE